MKEQDFVENSACCGWSSVSSSVYPSGNFAVLQSNQSLQRNNISRNYCPTCFRYLDDSLERHDPFFIEEMGKHHAVLFDLIIEPLSRIGIVVSNTQNSSSILDRFALNKNVNDISFYEKTKGHLRLGFRRPNLHKEMNNLDNEIGEYNKKSETMEAEFQKILDGAVSSLGLSAQDKCQILSRFKMQCRNFIITPERRDLSNLDMGESKAISLSTPNEQTVVNKLNKDFRKNDDLLKHLIDLQTDYSKLEGKRLVIENHISAIVTSMNNGTYSTKRRCCPTFLNLVDKYFF